MAPPTVQVGSVVDHRRGPSCPGAPGSAGTPVSVSWTGVAAGTAEHVLPIGPGSEKAWTVLNRVGAKGAPLPGYKGGSVFKNWQGRLPETPGVTYREWDVNPYAKGVNLGPERIVTGSDGSAYWTGNPYDTFLMFRGSTG
ncbi:MAG: ribonuclease domain-containing protein [Actinomycetales bacterium]